MTLEYLQQSWVGAVVRQHPRLRRVWRRGFRLMKSCSRVPVAVQTVGWRAVVEYGSSHWQSAWAQRYRRGSQAGVYALRSPLAAYPLLCRAGTSDRDVFWQVFLERQFACLDDARHVRLIIDCGANVGHSAAFFLTRFPDAHVIAIEPDAANVEMLRRNMQPYGDRVSVHHAAVWPTAAPLVVVRGRFLDGREWATQVRQCREGETPDVCGLAIDTLVRQSGFDRIDILKIDIEGSESRLFETPAPAWLDKVQRLIIELHGAECRRTFFASLPADAFDVLQSGELTLCSRHVVNPVQGATVN